MQQIGNYVVETDGQEIPTWCVRMAGSDEYISCHDCKRDALAATKRYQNADARRRMQSK
jgi:hypothetical protein